MLFFIMHSEINNQSVHSFKYISCYSLSWRVRLCGSKWRWFKYISCYSLSILFFSHCQTSQSFKYISCYSLSCPIKALTIPLKIFKYISCYSLSIQLYPIRKWMIDLNTSHVILYLCVACPLYLSHSYLNTSHVILYPYKGSSNIW